VVLVPIDFWERVNQLHKEVNRLFDEALRAVRPALIFDTHIEHIPPADICVDEAFVTVVVALPGALPEDVDVALEGNDTLVVRGRIERPVWGRIIQQECRFGPFERRIRLPEPVETSNLSEAEMSEGLLVVRLRRRRL